MAYKLYVYGPYNIGNHTNTSSTTILDYPLNYVDFFQNVSLDFKKLYLQIEQWFIYFVGQENENFKIKILKENFYENFSLI